MNLKVRRNGELVELRKVELESLSPPLYRTLIGYNSLKRLGYSISFIRPKKSASGEFERIRYNFIERGVMTKQLEGELEPDMKRGILNQLPRGDFSIILLLTQIPRRGVNIRLDKFEYEFLGCILMRNEETLDVVMNTTPTRDLLMPMYEGEDSGSTAEPA
ncbi:hypothetical protein EU546_01910 [Candidatus Thorarchaeota archaeon]|jgi:hypothetical protein|nr:MAG: hypothetical protein EU546_01910 [Candidatus Thorarchaeota archaeon]